ncbi:MAG: hypothetical protein GWO08_11480, partial [Gammaproteobacteria bacterium]|nr:hypothetical protein [Gammaproteobacteria bacterium]NIR94254.1 hypothetical protein [Gammaproteobacteria bacterium]NIW46868.1 hypothetical protein [Gammaproteobacteria bacterium]NIX57891.1 hypothetical protein [candidate division Zixibacteria bacterium]
MLRLIWIADPGLSGETNTSYEAGYVALLPSVRGVLELKLFREYRDNLIVSPADYAYPDVVTGGVTDVFIWKNSGNM